MATKKASKTTTVITSIPVDVPVLSVSEKLASGYYRSKLSWVPLKKDPAAAKAYHEDCTRLSAEFRADVLADLGITDHPKADLLFSKAYDMGHSSGFSEVYSYAQDLVELIQ
jgi:hypothetical protein